MSLIWRFTLALATVLIFIQAEDRGPIDPGLLEQIKPDFSKINQLICYQCHSMSNQLQPLCDKSMFKLATKNEKYNMSLQCPHHQNGYCFIKVTKSGKVTETVRGCTGPYDRKGNMMKVGCMRTENGSLCLCNTKFCNKAKQENSHFVIAITVPFFGCFLSQFQLTN